MTPAEPRDLEVHHVVPIIEGGEVCDPANVRVLCRPCHLQTRTPAVERSPDDLLVTEEVKERYDRQRAAAALPPTKPVQPRPIIQKR